LVNVKAGYTRSQPAFRGSMDGWTLRIILRGKKYEIFGIIFIDFTVFDSSVKTTSTGFRWCS